MSQIKRIPVDALEVGMYIADVSNAWVPDNNFARKGWVKNPRVIEQIIKLGVTDLYIDVEKGKGTEAGVEQEAIIQQQKKDIASLVKKPYHRPTPKVAFDEELELAKEIQNEAHELVNKVMQDAKMGKPVEVGPAQETAGAVLQSLEKNQNALLCLTHLRCKDRYLLEHSFNVSVLMGVLASSVGVSGDDLQTLVSGALLHDVGKIKIDDAILHKPGQLENHEWEEMKRHVTYGEAILGPVPDLAPEILDIVAHHHERMDGSGYPRGLAEDQLPMHSRMAAVADVYDAVTADRVYHRGMPPSTALKKMLEWSDERHLDKTFVYQFIRCLSVYPSGCLVLLNNQRIAVVQSVNPDAMDKPVVTVVYDVKKKAALEPFELDLLAKQDEVCIEKAVDPAQTKLDLQALLNSAIE
ncbi:HD-GYP domain-containing protein [Halioxenophilus aromaticivorans]|uniref:HD-GYP domain-containing protein n=1 Tax=Halioxenophilus aromaticivorans TaxID=1306992 RepID=A0AAV3U1Q6_9ALTE